MNEKASHFLILHLVTEAMTILISKCMSNLKSEKSRKALDSWLTPIEPNYHSLDEERFLNFAEIYYLEKEDISEDDFVKYATEFYPNTEQYHPHMYQKYYIKLTAVVQYLKWKNRK